MGNEQPDKTFQKFTATCHPALAACTLNPEQRLLFTLVKVEESLLNWRTLIDPLFQKPHLLLPFKIVPHDYLTDLGCCIQQDFHRPDVQIKKIFYQPFIYTLDNEIRSRKQKNTKFRQQQLWKMIGYLSKAILQWKSVYPSLKLGGICPQNIVMNAGGQMKIVCRLSFFDYQYIEEGRVYSLPRKNVGQSTVYRYEQDYNQIQSEQIYSVGLVLLEAATLEMYGNSQLNIGQKKEKLIQEGNFNHDIVDIILKMLEQNPSCRPNAGQLVQLSKLNKTKHM